MSSPEEMMLPLAPLAGRWSTHGEVYAASDAPAASFTATDSYEWEAGGRLLLHRWDARMPEGRSRGLEVIGRAAAAGEWFVHVYDDQGGQEEMRARMEDGRWMLTGDATRFSGRFSADGSLLRGEWELREEDSWRPWMWVELTRLG